MEHFTLDNVLSKIKRWFEAGRSVFREELAKYRAATASQSRAPP
jgi:hypothetical protein